MRGPALVAAALALALLLSTGARSAMAATRLNVSLFPSAGWILHLGIAEGFFAKEGLDIHPNPVTGSVQQITGMMDGAYDLGLTALDNVIAYDAGQGAAKFAQSPDLFAFMGGEGGGLHLIAAPAVARIADLKGKVLAVDAASTGFAFMLYRSLALHGVMPGSYELLAVGSSGKRYEALTQGKAQGALLDRPFDAFAVQKGFKDLAAMRQIFPHYQSSVGMARRAWAAAHHAELVGFIRAYVEAGLFLFDPANKETAIDVLMKTTPRLDRANAETIYRNTIGPESLVSPTATLDLKGVATVVALRGDYGHPKAALDAARFYDLTYYKEAVK